MVYRGTFKNGIVTFDEPPSLEEGVAVQVAPLESPATQVTSKSPPESLADFLADFIGRAEGLPEDMARNHDHYIHGTRKR